MLLEYRIRLKGMIRNSKSVTESESGVPGTFIRLCHPIMETWIDLSCTHVSKYYIHISAFIALPANSC